MTIIQEYRHEEVPLLQTELELSLFHGRDLCPACSGPLLFNFPYSSLHLPSCNVGGA